MVTGVFNPRDNTSATATRPAHDNQDAGVRRWFTDGGDGTRVYAQDLNQIIAQFRAAMDVWGVGDEEGDDTVLTQLLSASFAAHTRRNLLPNPRFDHWPAGAGPFATSGLGPAGWVMDNVGTAVASVTRAAGLLNGRYCLEWDYTVADGGGGNVRISADPIRSVAQLAGRRVTLSGTIKGAAGISQLAPRVVQSFGQGGSAAVQTNFPVIPVTTSAERFEVALDVPSIAGKTILDNGDDFSEIQFLRAAADPLGKIWLEDLKLEIGNRASAFIVPAEDEERRDFGVPAAKNFAHNPSFLLWQSGATAVAAGPTNPHIADRWRCRHPVGSAASVSRGTGFAGAQYCCILQRWSTNTSTDGITIGQQVETAVARHLAGRWVVLSFDLLGGANLSSVNRQIAIGFAAGTGTDEAFTPTLGVPTFPTGNTSFNATPLNGAWRSSAPASGSRRVRSGAWLVPSGTTEFGWSIGFAPVGTAGANDSISVTNIKLELTGPHGRATAFEPEPPDETLRACQRFYRKSFNVGTAPAQNAGAATGEWRFPATRAAAAQNRLGSVRFGAAMRAAPTVTLYNPAAANAQARNLTGGADCSASAAQNISEQGFEIVATGDGAAAVGDDLGVHWTADARL